MAVSWARHFRQNPLETTLVFLAVFSDTILLASFVGLAVVLGAALFGAEWLPPMWRLVWVGVNASLASFRLGIVLGSAGVTPDEYRRLTRPR